MKMEDGENAEITMYGEVVETHPTHWYTGEKLKGDYIAQDEFLQDLNSLAGARSLTIRMNSLGGDSLVGMVIHNRLRELSAKGTKLVCIVDGAAMSAASVIMSACSEVRINPASLVMIHRCWGYMWGGYNADNLREAANMFDAYDRAAVTTYQRKTGLDEAELLRLMSETTYLTGREAVEKGFADKLLEDAEPLDIAASADGRSLFVRGRQFHLTPGMFAPDTIPTVTPGAPAPAAANTNPPAQTGSEGGRTMANNLEELRAEIGRILGVNNQHSIIVVGAGNLGRALMQNFHFKESGFRLLAAFDIAPALIGTEIAGTPVLDMAELERFVPVRRPDVAVLTVPQSAAQSMADRLIELGIRGFWNFTNVELSSDLDGICFEDVHFADSLLTLSYRITER